MFADVYESLSWSSSPLPDYEAEIPSRQESRIPLPVLRTMGCGLLAIGLHI